MQTRRGIIYLSPGKVLNWSGSDDLLVRLKTFPPLLFLGCRLSQPSTPSRTNLSWFLQSCCPAGNSAVLIYFDEMQKNQKRDMMSMRRSEPKVKSCFGRQCVQGHQYGWPGTEFSSSCPNSWTMTARVTEEFSFLLHDSSLSVFFFILH